MIIPDHLPKSKDGEDLWVFAYASLMWRPDFEHAEVLDATLHGYNRRLCIFSYQYRGTPECPGLVFGLDKGGSCRGRVLRVEAKNVDRVVAYLYEREMINQVYHPRMVSVTINPHTDNPIAAKSLAFIADTDHIQYAAPMEDAEAIKLIKQGHGLGGPCIDYLSNTADHLRELGLIDHQLEKLVKASR